MTQTHQEGPALTDACLESLLDRVKRAVKQFEKPEIVLERKELLHLHRKALAQYKPSKIDPDLQVDLEPGWLLPGLIAVDMRSWGRWEYWYDLHEYYELNSYRWNGPQMLGAPIPRINFRCDRNFGGIKNRYVDGGIGHKHISDCLDLIPNRERLGWRGWSNWKYVDFFLDWLLYGFNHKGYQEPPEEDSETRGASMRLYQAFNLAALMLWPWDYFGDILADQHHGKHLGFYPTPHPVVDMMTACLFNADLSNLEEAVMDPCLGTGRMLLHASNYSLNLWGMDINPTVIKCALVNGYLYAPWLVQPFPFIDRRRRCDPKKVSDGMMKTMEGRPDVQSYLAESEFDPEGFMKSAPIYKRRRPFEAGKPYQDVAGYQGELF